MPYVQTNWKDYPDLSTAITAARLNNIEAGVVAAYVQGTGTLVNADVANGAAVAYAKLNLALSILNGDISASAAIAIAKLADPGAGKVIGSSGGVATAVTPPGTELDYAQITASVNGVTASTEGTAVALVTGNAVTYDGTRVKLELFIPEVTSAAATNYFHIVFIRDGSAIGQATGVIAKSDTSNGIAFSANLFETPSAASHTYAVKVFAQSTTTINFHAGAGGAGALVPAYLRVTKA